MRAMSRKVPAGERVKRAVKRNWWKIFRELFLLASIALLIFPFIFMILNATKTNAEFMTKPFGWAEDFAASFTQNFKAVWKGIEYLPEFGGGYIEVSMYTPFMKMFLNSAVLTFGSLVILLIVALMFGYAIGTKDFKGKGALIILLIIVQAVPFFGYIMPLYVVSDWLNLLNSRIGVIPVYVAVSIPMAVILFQGYFSSFPKEIEEAALIDGCNEVQKFIMIVSPLSVGAIFSLGIINFMGFWNEYAIANLMLGANENLRTINIGVMLSQRDEGQTNYVYQFMLLTLSALPTMLFFSVFQKKILSGVTLGGVKG